MNTSADARLVDLEARMSVMHARLSRLERLNGVDPAHLDARPEPRRARPATSTAAAGPPPAPAQSRSAAAPAARPAIPRHAPGPASRTALDLEELVGGRVLAWIGATAIVAGLAFFFALAVSRGWIGIEARVLLGSGAATALLGTGVWLRERRGRNEAAMAAAATGLAGLFLAVVVATRVYDLVPDPVGLLLALVVAATGTLLALRWNATVIGALGTLGGVLSPLLAGAHADGATIALLWVATSAGAAVLVRKRWDALALALFVAATPQWLPWAAGDATHIQAVVALAAFGITGVAAAIGFELRSGSGVLRQSAAFLTAANALVLALGGWVAFAHTGDATLGKVWIAALALAHAAVGSTMRLDRRVSPALRTLALAIGIVLADVAWGLFTDGAVTATGWALSAVAFAWAAWRGRFDRVERGSAAVGVGGQIACALIHVVASDVPVGRVAGGASAAALIAVVALSAACLVSARFAEAGHPEWRVALDSLGLAAIAYLTLVTLDGVALVAALAAQACALAALAKARDDSVARAGGLAFLAAATVHMVVVEMPPRGFVGGVSDVPAMIGAAAAVAAAQLRMAASGRLGRNCTLSFRAGAAVTVLCALSVAIVSAFQPSGDGGAMLLEMGRRQEGQMLVSALWSVAGAGTLVLGLRRGSRELRLAGLALLIAAGAKVFLFDLATLTSIYRVASFIALGVILLLGSYAWQRSRPAPLPDLRNA